MTEKLAGALLRIKIGDEWLIPEPLRDVGSAQDIYRAVQFDHGILVAHDGTNAPQNIWPMLTPEHREKSREDTKKAAKTKRILKKHATAAEQTARSAAEFRANLLAGIGKADGEKLAEPQRKSRKIQSAGFQKGQRPLTGKISWKK